MENFCYLKMEKEGKNAWKRADAAWPMGTSPLTADIKDLSCCFLLFCLPSCVLFIHLQWSGLWFLSVFWLSLPLFWMLNSTLVTSSPHSQTASHGKWYLSSPPIPSHDFFFALFNVLFDITYIFSNNTSFLDEIDAHHDVIFVAGEGWVREVREEPFELSYHHDYFRQSWHRYLDFKVLSFSLFSLFPPSFTN